MEILTVAGLTALLQVIAIDLVLAGDNAVVIGLAAAGLEPAQRKKAILVGILAATVLRILFATVAVHSSRSSGCCSPAACSCSGSAGRCGANCAAGTRKARTAPHP